MFRYATIFVGALSILLSLYAVLAPVVVLAQSPLVPCGTEYKTGDTLPAGKNIGDIKDPCGWGHLIQLVSNVANYLIILGAAFSAVAFGWAGFLMMTAGGEMSKIEQAKSIFGKVLVGFLLMLSAWLIVYAIEAGFIKNTTEFKSLLTSPAS